MHIPRHYNVEGQPPLSAFPFLPHPPPSPPARRAPRPPTSPAGGARVWVGGRDGGPRGGGGRAAQLTPSRSPPARPGRPRARGGVQGAGGRGEWEEPKPYPHLHA